ncbi:MAG: tRNA (adenosine(37)-N6)-threonylcarbamoyltransferase complex dimerization subunit type 1 TsaB [Planctomycetes bacterium]|nr:tRNA (adenosine(37)-N6)-threonylcarbamoyltransferase complex dimerization subunit type 1 TsaB [Planctomycetota bacterium]
MFILAIETSGPRGGVALADDDEVLGEESFEEGMVHGRALVPAMDRLVRKAGITPKDLGLVAVDVGPGSYTGVRVGVAAARMLAFAIRCPVAPIMSTDVLAENAEDLEDFVCPILDARWDQVYAAAYRRDWVWLRTEGPGAYAPAELAARLAPETTVFGSGVEKYPGVFAKFAHGPADWCVPKGSVVARLGWQALQAGAATDANSLHPMYLRPTEAEVKFGVVETPPPPGC